MQATLRATFPSVRHAVDAVTRIIRARVVPAALELVDRGFARRGRRRHLGGGDLAPQGTAALLLIEVDGLSELVAGEAARVEQACREAGATELLRAAATMPKRAGALARPPRALAGAGNDLGPRSSITMSSCRRAAFRELFELVERLKTRFRLTIPCFGHVGDGNIHVNIMVAAGRCRRLRRAHEAEGELFEGVVALEGSITGEHGIGFTKANYLGLELTPETIALMKRVKQAFDPNGILNPGKIFQ